MAELAPEPYKSGIAYADNVRDEIECDKGNKGTALELARAAEESDREIWRIGQETGFDGESMFRVEVGFSPEGLEGGPVPKPIHNKLTEWGYKPSEHADSSAANEQHVYVKA